MEPLLELSASSRSVAGILLLSVVTIETGGMLLLRVVRGRLAMTPFQQAFARAGHAHAAVLVTLGLICQPLVDATRLTGLAETVARLGVPAAAILMSAGFFLSSMGRDVTRPNRLIALVWLGAASIAAGVVTLGIGLLIA